MGLCNESNAVRITKVLGISPPAGPPGGLLGDRLLICGVQSPADPRPAWSVPTSLSEAPTGAEAAEARGPRALGRGLALSLVLQPRAVRTETGGLRASPAQLPATDGRTNHVMSEEGALQRPASQRSGNAAHRTRALGAPELVLVQICSWLNQFGSLLRTPQPTLSGNHGQAP